MLFCQDSFQHLAPLEFGGVGQMAQIDHKIPFTSAFGRTQAFDQDADFLADELAAELFLKLFVQVLKLFRTGLNHCGGNFAGHTGGGSIFARTKAKDVNFGKADPLGDGHRLLEIVFSFTGETHDDIGGDSGAVQCCLDLADDFHVLIQRILSAHFPQDCRACRLERQVQMRHNRGVCGENFQQSVGDVGRFERTEPNTFQPRYGNQLFQQIRLGVSILRVPVFSPGGGLAVSAEKNPRQDDFLMPGRNEVLGLVQHGFYVFVTNLCPNSGYNTV